MMNEIVFEAQRLQLESPARACVNSESAFVKDRIYKLGYPELAKEYWNWVCSSASRSDEVGPEKFGQEVYDQYKELKKIDAGFVMPSWGTYGT